MVRNPMNPHQVSRISLDLTSVDCIVFWTKNPEKMLPKLDLIKDYPYYFQLTLNPYDISLEPDVPRKAAVVAAFKRLSDIIGPQRIIWRYDPILLNGTIDMEYHVRYFDVLAKKLQGYTSKCVISFIDSYRKADKAFKAKGIVQLDDEAKRLISQKVSVIAAGYGLTVETCAEEIDLNAFGIGHASCIDTDLIEAISGTRIIAKKDRNQRKACGCAVSVDIGAYDTCPHGCLYCYANASQDAVKRNTANHEADYPLLCSRLTELDKIYERRG